MSAPDCFKPLIGIKEANKNDEYPQTLKESNKLYAKSCKQGFFAITGTRHENAPNWPGVLKLADPYIAIMAQLITNLIEGNDDPIEGHFGFPDFVNPLYFANMITIPINYKLFETANDDENSWGKRILSGTAGALLSPFTVAIALATLLTTYLWDLAKVVVAAVSVVASSAVWYPIKLAMLKHNEKSDDCYEDAAGLDSFGEMAY